MEYEIRRTLIHELAHHFGYSEDDLEEFEDCLKWSGEPVIGVERNN